MLRKLFVATCLVLLLLLGFTAPHAQAAFVTSLITVQNIDGSFSQVPVTTFVADTPLVLAQTVGFQTFAQPSVFQTAAFTSYDSCPTFAASSFAFSPGLVVHGGGFREAFVGFSPFANVEFAASGPFIANGVAFRAAFARHQGNSITFTNHPAGFRAVHPFAHRL